MAPLAPEKGVCLTGCPFAVAMVNTNAAMTSLRHIVP